MTPKQRAIGDIKQLILDSKSEARFERSQENGNPEYWEEHIRLLRIGIDAVTKATAKKTEKRRTIT